MDSASEKITASVQDVSHGTSIILESGLFLPLIGRAV